MRRIALLGLVILLPGCGYHTWYDPPFTGGTSPNAPDVKSQNIQRVLGRPPAEAPISQESGDIWPGPLPVAPTLGDLEAQAATGQAAADGLLPSGGPATLPPTPAHGSGTPPMSASPAVPAPAPSARPRYAAPAAPPPPRESGKVLHTPGGPAVTTGGTPGYSTAIQPGGGQSIIVPNGNGTSTVIHPDGRIETIPTPK